MSDLLDKQELLKLYPDYDSVLGPYTRRDNRKHIVLNNSNTPKTTKCKIRTISYPKALVESKLKRRLHPNETIDHKDGDFTNDTLSNLQILDRQEHCKNDAIKYQPATIQCVQCGKDCDLTPSQVRTLVANSKRGKYGPFCSRTCSGIYGRNIQIDTDLKILPIPLQLKKCNNK